MKTDSGIHILEIRDLLEMLAAYPPETSIHILAREPIDPEGEDEEEQYILHVQPSSIGVAIIATKL